MKIAVVGGGGIGGFVAVMPARVKEKIRLVARGRPHKAIICRGICVELNDKKICIEPYRVYDDLIDFKEYRDVVPFCTKRYYDLDEAVRFIHPVTSDNTPFVPLCSGFENSERVQWKYLRDRVAGRAVYKISYIKKSGLVTQTALGCRKKTETGWFCRGSWK